MHNFRTLPIYKKRFVIAFIKFLLVVEVVENFFINLPYLILTPRGVIINRRRFPSRYHFVGERRFAEIMRHDLKLYLYQDDDGQRT